MKTLAALLLLFFVLLSGGSPLHGADRVALLTGPDDQALRDLFIDSCRNVGATGDDVTGLLAGDEVKFRRYCAFLVGPAAANHKPVSAWMRRNGGELQEFVARGGTVLVFNQSPDFWDIEPWFPPDVFLLRGWRSPGKPTWISGDHPLFNTPHRLDLKLLASEPPGPHSAFGRIRVSRGFNRLADALNGGPWCMEAGWGKGRVVILAWGPTPEEPAENGRKAASRKAVEEPSPSRLLVENAVAYAVEASHGGAPVLPEEAVAGAWGDEARLRPELFTPQSDKEFQARVNAAVDRGIAFLKGQQKEDGSWGICSVGKEKYKVGPTAMALLGLLVSGVNKHDGNVKCGFDYLLETPPELTYETGLAMMALEEKAAPLYERFELERLPPEKRKSFEFQRNLTDDEMRYMEYCRDRILSHAAKGGTWRYSPSVGDGDISNGQYAVLGLKSAARCGLKVDAEVWKTVLDYYLSYQQPSGPSTTYLRFKNFEKDWTPKFYAEKAEARGWQYRFGQPGRPEDVLGTHVCIGIACLLFCYEELMTHSRAMAGKYTPKVRQAVKDGQAWLYRNWSIDHIPNGTKFYYYYYIYSLERVGVLTGNRFIGDRDWYREGGTYLLAKQSEDGSWHSRGGEFGTPVTNTTFALLFLKRSTPPPVITVGR